MSFNPNPFTIQQQAFLEAVRKKLIEIRDPEKDFEDGQDFEFYIEPTKKFGPIPKIRFKPNSLVLKEQIMLDTGYKPDAGNAHWRAKRNAAASAFDKTWDGLMFRLVKAGKMIATFNQMFSMEGQAVSDLIGLVQRSIAPDKVEGAIQDPNRVDVAPSSYLDELKAVNSDG